MYVLYWVTKAKERRGEERTADQSKVGKWTEGDDGNLSRVQICLLNQEGSSRLIYRLGSRWREVLVSQAV